MRSSARYGAATPHLRDAIEAFPPAKLRAWCEGLGQETFVGSSGRVFPRSLKASPLLRAWLRRLDAAGVVFKPRHRWTGWGDDGALTFETPTGVVTERPTRPCWRSAAQAGRDSAPTEAGPRS